MGFTESISPDITESIPASLSSRVAAVISSYRDVRYDVTVGGIGFLVAPDKDGNAYIRKSVPVRKAQQDTSKEPGEQSLDGYWIRSQNSWHRGTGINFYEPGSETDTQYRFADSSGVDVWTPGQITALRSMTLAQAAAGTCYVQDAGNGYFVYLSDTAVLGWKGGSSYALNSPPAAYNGRYHFFGYKKYIRVGWNAVADATLGIWNGGTNTVIAGNATVEPLVWYLKDRLIVAHGKNLFEVPLNVTPSVDLSSTSAGLYYPTDANTSWVDATEGPNAIYLAHTDGTHDGIVRFTLQDAAAGQTPKLSQAYRVLDLPAGERIYKIFGYLGRYLLLSTSIGIRVCAIDSEGGLTMGAVTIPAAESGQYNSFHGDGNYIFIGGADVPQHGTSGGSNIMEWDTAAGFIRINLGEPVGDGADLRFAYANDIRTTVNGTVTSSVRFADGEHAIAVNGSGIWVTNTASYVPGGYLSMGRVRYDSLIPKVFRSLDIGGSIGGGTLKLQLFDEVDNELTSITMDSTTGVFPTVDLDLNETHIFVRAVGSFTWSAGDSPLLDLVQLRAMPSPRRLRQIALPLRCDDKEQDARGKHFGRDGFAYERVAALEELEETGTPVVVIDHRTGETYTAMIEEIQYTGVVAPQGANKNYGGRIYLTLTKLA